MQDDPLDLYRMLARERYGRLTPWRLGVCVGMAGHDYPSPYKTYRANAPYAAGKAYGRDKRAELEGVFGRSHTQGNRP